MDAADDRPSTDEGRPAGDAYDWFRRGERLLGEGNPAAAAQLLRRALNADPRSRSAQEALARALFDARHYQEAGELFAGLVAEHPADDYARYGLGLSALRRGDLRLAVEHLSLAVAMKPHDRHYTTALNAARVRFDAMTGADGMTGADVGEDGGEAGSSRA